MSNALSLTFQHLSKTKNAAAVDVLIAGLDSPNSSTRDCALRALLARPDANGHQEIFRRLKTLDAQCREIVCQRPERLAKVAGDAMRSPDASVCAAACEAILSLRLYDTLPALVAVLGEPEHPNVAPAAQTILKLTEQLYGELCAPEDRGRRDMDGLRRRVTSVLETGVVKFRGHRRKEVIEAFLLVAKQQNVVLRQVLQHPQDANHQAIVEILSNSSQGGVVRLLLSFLFEETQIPQVIKGVLAKRTDLKFVKHFLQTVKAMTPRTAQEALGQIERLDWAVPGHPVLGKLDDAGQRDAVRLLVATSIPRKDVLQVISHLLLEGTVEGSRAAAEALAEFRGPDADALTVRALNNRDPMVRAHLIRQLRPRGIPGAMSLLLRMVDHPSVEVREALRDSLPEFTVRHFLVNFDALPEALLATTGNMVRKIDAESVPMLVKEMGSLSPVRRRRAVQAAGAMGLVREVEQKIIELLSDDDHMVRIEVAKALATCDSAPTWEALRDALLDRSVIVQEAAEQSLEQITRSLAREASQEQPVGTEA